ncbi:hypothetical protein [Terrimonas alba]|uniref:hypothetical protein n=1 Tax=Terrimonas alba TaxID=3349636 RepID=UPI0035F35D65
MKSIYLTVVVSFLVLTVLSSGSCNKPPFKPDYENVGGYVIGKENCNTDETQDYWLLDFTVYPNSPQLGDTLTLNGITYTNVLKLKGLDQRLKQIGMRVSIDYRTITPSKITTTGCTVTFPVTYSLKEIFIIHQGEIR